MIYFQILLLEEAETFINDLDAKTAKKVLYDLARSQQTNDPRLFKKLRDDIWEFRSRKGYRQVRLLAFWDKRNADDTLVVATHGFFKKTDKVPGNEIERAQSIRKKYFETKE